MNVVIVDNYDSFTFNLYQLVGSITKVDPLVVRNDALTAAQIEALGPTHIIISPGPGSPDVARDFGVSRDVITELSSRVPTLGVCLGHQGIVHYLGGTVRRAPEIVHGKASRIWADTRSRLFSGLPDHLEVMRYHSLVGERTTLPEGLRITAYTLDSAGEPDLLMAVEHVHRPLFGVQFHPESIGTPLGEQIVARFLAVHPTEAAP